MIEEVRSWKKTLAEQLIGKMEARQFEAYYCETGKEAFDKACSLMPEGSSVTCGGSTTLKQIGMIPYLQGEGGKKYHYLDRGLAKTAQEKREVFAKAALTDYYLMSSNAITLDGELVNVDGVGNRVAALCFGPENVIVIASLNKVAKDAKSALDRVRNMAAPPNAIRLNCGTPCTVTGSCGNCLKPGCICADLVVTRFSRTPGRLKVILVGEDLGY